MTEPNLPDLEQPQLAAQPAQLAPAEAAELAAAGAAQGQGAESAAPTQSVKKRFSFHLPRSRWIGLALFLLGATLQFLIVASDQRFTFSVLLGFISCAVAAFGALSLAA
jgi:hypothetical protein